MSGIGNASATEVARFALDLIGEVDKIRHSDPIVAAAFAQQFRLRLDEIDVLRMCIVGLIESKSEMMKQLVRYSQEFGPLKGPAHDAE